MHCDCLALSASGMNDCECIRSQIAVPGKQVSYGQLAS